jgi:hypothetical protein
MTSAEQSGASIWSACAQSFPSRRRPPLFACFSPLNCAQHAAWRGRDAGTCLILRFNSEQTGQRRERA